MDCTLFEACLIACSGHYRLSSLKRHLTTYPSRKDQQMRDILKKSEGATLSNWEQKCNAGINVTGYHPTQGTPGLLQRNVCPAPGLLHTGNAGGGGLNDAVPGAGHLHQLAFKHENC